MIPVCCQHLLVLLRLLPSQLTFFFRQKLFFIVHIIRIISLKYLHWLRMLQLHVSLTVLSSLNTSKKVKFSHTRYRASGLELIPVYKQSACRWQRHIGEWVSKIIYTQCTKNKKSLMSSGLAEPVSLSRLNCPNSMSGSRSVAGRLLDTEKLLSPSRVLIRRTVRALASAEQGWRHWNQR